MEQQKQEKDQLEAQALQHKKKVQEVTEKLKVSDKKVVSGMLFFWQLNCTVISLSISEPEVLSRKLLKGRKIV